MGNCLKKEDAKSGGVEIGKAKTEETKGDTKEVKTEKKKKTEENKEGLSEAQLAELKEDFDSFDADGSGAISAKELGKALRLRGFQVSEREVQQILKDVDKDQDHQLNFPEFCDLMTSKEKRALANESKLVSALWKDMEKDQAQFEKEAAETLKEGAKSPVSAEKSIVVGPVIGKVTDTTARILIETKGACTLKLTLEAKESKKKFEFKESFHDGIPNVFRCTGLKANTHYTVTIEGLTDFSSSFRTMNYGKEDMTVIAASCDNGPKKRGKENMFDKLYKEYIETGKLDLLIRHGDQVYADLAFHQGKILLKDKDSTLTEEQKDEQILQYYKNIYRNIWMQPDVRRVMANVSTLCLWDDHEVRNDWGTFKQDIDPTSVDRRIAKHARQAYWEYQRQLWDDIGPRSAAEEKKFIAESQGFFTQPPVQSLNLTVVSGKNLAAMDRRTSDPYLQVQLLDDEAKVIVTHKSKVVEKSLSPKFDFQLPETKQEDLERAFSIRLQVWDNDLGEDDFMGEINLPLRVGCPIKDKTSLHTSIRLRGSLDPEIVKSKHKISGELEIKVEVVHQPLKETKEEVELKYTSRSMDSEGSFHAFGQFGVMIVDGRGCRSFGHQHGEPKKFLGTQQWYRIEQALSPDGVLKDVKSLLVVHSMAPVLMATDSSHTVGYIPPQVDKMGFGLHPQEQVDYINFLEQWSIRKGGKFFLVGGDMHFGCLSNIYSEDRNPSLLSSEPSAFNLLKSTGGKPLAKGRESKIKNTPSKNVPEKDAKLRVVCQQMITSAISNSCPPKPVYWMLRRFMKGRGKLGQPGQDQRYKFRHIQFLYDRNFGVVHMESNKGGVTITPSLVSATKGTKTSEEGGIVQDDSDEEEEQHDK